MGRFPPIGVENSPIRGGKFPTSGEPQLWVQGLCYGDESAERSSQLRQ